MRPKKKEAWLDGVCVVGGCVAEPTNVFWTVDKSRSLVSANQTDFESFET
jgi:hypothetical protein